MHRPRPTDDERGIRQSHIPPGSVFYRRVLPLFLAFMAVLTIGLILVAAGVLLGLVPWR